MMMKLLKLPLLFVALVAVAGLHAHHRIFFIDLYYTEFNEMVTRTGRA